MVEFFSPYYEQMFTEEDLRSADRQIQLEVMEDWFRQNFEDPAQNPQYITAEGGYQWIWGGPYDAREELEDAFYDIVPEDIIEELVEKLLEECPEWAPTLNSIDDDYLVDIAQTTDYYENFSKAINDINELLLAKIDDSVVKCFRRMLHVNVITAFETYLSDAFINTIFAIPKMMQRFVETTAEFQKKKSPLSDVFKEYQAIEKNVRSHLVGVVWHNLNRVKPIYYNTLGINFPDNLDYLFLAIKIRHDIVHRNGKSTEGKDVQIEPQDINKLIAEVESFIDYVDTQLQEKVRDHNDL